MHGTRLTDGNPMTITQDGWTFRAQPGATRLRVLLLTSDDPQHAWLRLMLSQQVDLLATIVEPGAAQKRRLLGKRRWRDLAYRHYQGRRQALTGRARWRREYFARLSEDLPPATSPVHRVVSVNAATTRRLVSEIRPDLTVICGTGVLGRRLITDTPGMMVNIHGGWLPEYKGNHGVYFAYLHQDWGRIGATLHLVTPVLDAGPVLDRVTPGWMPGDTDEQLYTRSVHRAALRLTERVHLLERGEPWTATPQEPHGVTYRHRDRKPLPELGLWHRRLTGRHRLPDARTPAAPALRSDTAEQIAELGYLIAPGDPTRLRRRIATALRHRRTAMGGPAQPTRAREDS
ncbi:formyltransferase family protein [Streptomyces sp. NBC_01411]|uniref:formyltransferase family protein n=1 Tax=Streptomyces sp. NBC_01411 TaxID=2903857 RepID=UPI00324EB4F1